jgi:hypothetical protein
LNLL